MQPECRTAVPMDADIPRLMDKKRSGGAKAMAGRGRVVGRSGAPGGSESRAIRWEAQLIGKYASWWEGRWADQPLDQHCVNKTFEDRGNVTDLHYPT